MKTFIFHLSILALILNSLASCSQEINNKFEGTITMGITYDSVAVKNTEARYRHLLDLNPSKFEIEIKNSKILITEHSKKKDNPLNKSYLFERDIDSLTFLTGQIDPVGKVDKFAIRSVLSSFYERLGRDLKSKRKIETTEETKVLNGYKCKKTIIKGTGINSYTQEIWVTDELPKVTFINTVLECFIIDVDGFPIRSEIMNDNELTIIELINVESKIVNDRSFNIPKDYIIR